VSIAAKSVLDHRCSQLQTECRAGKDATVVDSLPAAALYAESRAKAAVVFALESGEINFAFPACCFPKQFLHHRFSTHFHPAASLPSRNHNAGAAQSFGSGVQLLVMAVSAVEVQ